MDIVFVIFHEDEDEDDGSVGDYRRRWSTVHSFAVARNTRGKNTLGSSWG